MAKPVGIEVDAAELRKALRYIGDQGLKDALKKANKDAAQVVVAEAVVPVRTGRLKGSLRALGSQRAGQAKAGGARVPYAARHHWSQGRPFFTDALDRHRNRVVDQYEQAIDVLLAAIRGR